MRISKVILVCNDNSNYYQFANDVYDIWQKYIKIEPHLFIITDDKSKLDIHFGDRTIQYIKPVKDIPTAFQSQVIRLLLPSLFEDDIVLITDIDMIPLNRKFFKSYLKYLDDDFFVRYFQNYQMCYNCAKGSIWKEMFNINSISEIKSKITQWYQEYNGMHTTDQRILHKSLEGSFCNKLILTTYLPNKTPLPRLSTYSKFTKFQDVPLNELTRYIDFHCHHVFKNDELVEPYRKIVNYLLGKK